MRRLTILSLVAAGLLAAACDRNPLDTPAGQPSPVIKDGTDADGNAQFFFLPPLVPSPEGHPNYDEGEFNPEIRRSIEVTICELAASHLDLGKPTAATPCGPTIKVFPAGTVEMVSPLVTGGWWSSLKLPSDGFYYVRWDTRASTLDVDKFYRIRVLLSGVEMGIADIDPMNGLREFKHSASDQVVQIIDNVWLPITFRIERGAFCTNPSGCVEKTITNDNPEGDFQIIAAEDPSGAVIAGGVFYDGWLPTGTNPDGTPRPTSVVVSIEKVETGAADPSRGTLAKPCHIGSTGAPLPLQQFNGCFKFSTTPELQPIDETGRTFVIDVLGAVCVTLDENDPRFHFLQLWKSDPEATPPEPAQPLKSAEVPPDILDPEGCKRAYASGPQAGAFAYVRDGLRILGGAFGRVFGVRQAHAVDLGLGGLMPAFSNVGPALTAEITRVSAADLTVDGGTTTQPTARILGTHLHSGEPVTHGIPGMDVTFSVAAGHGTLAAPGTPRDSDTPTNVTVVTSGDPENPEGPDGGYASVNWTLPTAPGTYTLRASGQALAADGSNHVTFTATVPDVGSIAGTVWSGAEKLLPGAHVELLDGGGDRVIAVDTAESNTAAFRFSNLQPGAYHIRASSSGHDPVTVMDTVSAGQERHIELHLPQRPASMTGVVTNGLTGAPLPGASVTIVGTGRSTVTDARGGYSFTNLSPGTDTVRVSYPYFITAEASIQLNPGAAVVLPFALDPAGPFMVLSPASPITLEATAGAAPYQDNISVANGGSGTLEGLALTFVYPPSLVCDTCTPPRMVGVYLNATVVPANITLHIEVDETIPAGDYSFSFTVSSTNSLNGPINYPFTLRVKAAEPVTAVPPADAGSCPANAVCVPHG